MIRNIEDTKNLTIESIHDTRALKESNEKNNVEQLNGIKELKGMNEEIISEERKNGKAINDVKHEMSGIKTSLEENKNDNMVIQENQKVLAIQQGVTTNEINGEYIKRSLGIKGND